MSRRGWGDDAIYWVADRKRYVGAASLGFRPDGKRLRKVVTGKTKQEVKDKLKALRDQLAQPVQSSRGRTRRRRSGSPGSAWNGPCGTPRRTTCRAERGGAGELAQGWPRLAEQVAEPEAGERRPAGVPPGAGRP